MRVEGVRKSFRRKILFSERKEVDWQFSRARLLLPFHSSGERKRGTTARGLGKGGVQIDLRQNRDTIRRKIERTMRRPSRLLGESL